ncbi:site-specific integrase [bacterium]|nr:site-specific integrase [bacterium]
MGVKVKRKGNDTAYWVFICHKGRRKSIRVGRRAAANKVSEQIQAQLALGQYSFEPEKVMPNFAQYAEHWLETYAEKNLKASTLVNYRSAISHHLNPAFGRLPLDQIKTPQVSAFISDQLDQGLSPATVRNLKNMLAKVLKTAIQIGRHISTNPCDAVDRIQDDTPSDNRQVTFTLEQRTRFESVIREHYPQYHPLVVTGFRSGMRIGELIGLKWDDIDWEKRLISVNRTVTRGVVTSPKSKASRRQIRMSSQVMDALRAELVKAKQQKLEQGLRVLPEWVFTGTNGQPIQYNNFLARVWKPALERAGLGGLTPHSMRSAYATHRIDAGHPVHEISKELGHTSTIVTMASYYRFRPELATSDIDALDKVV